MTNRLIYLVFCFFLFFTGLFAQGGSFFYPHITKLDSSNYLFIQYSEDVGAARKAIANGRVETDLPFKFYTYRAQNDDTIIRIAARCSIPQDALITLNRIASAGAAVGGKLLILPTVPALYLPKNPTSGIEKLTAAIYEKNNSPRIAMKIPHPKNGKKRLDLMCIPNALLDGTVRAFFFRPFYTFPLKTGVLSSDFGMRRSPFSGKWLKHGGIDIAAPRGTPVYACSSGKIVKTGFSTIYGKYILLHHLDGRESLYGHLSKICVSLNQSVKSDIIIGEVGSTGLSTGPHLHFEVHENGIKKNPGHFVDKNELDR